MGAFAAIRSFLYVPYLGSKRYRVLTRYRFGRSLNDVGPGCCGTGTVGCYGRGLGRVDTDISNTLLERHGEISGKGSDGSEPK